MMSPNWTSRMGFSSGGRRDLAFLRRTFLRQAGLHHAGIRRQQPCGSLKSDVLADAQLAAVGFEQIANLERLPGWAQLFPRSVFVRGLDHPAFLVILPLDVGRAGDMRR